MNENRVIRSCGIGCVVILVLFVSGCASNKAVPLAENASSELSEVPSYLIGPGDELQVFVWDNEELSAVVPVRPDGRITTPLVEDVKATGRTPSELARDIEARLATYIRKPVVSVTVTDFIGRTSEQVRVVGQAVEPQTIPYKENATLLDVMISVGGLTEFASGNRAKIIRTVDGKKRRLRVRLDDLMNDGDISANVRMRPGDILLIPEAWF